MSQTQAKNDEGIIRNAAGSLRGYVLTAGSTAATLKLYDSADATGVLIGDIAAITGDSTPVTGINVPFATALFSVLTGTGASLMVYIE